MANTKSAKKALRQSLKRKAQNQFWKEKIKTMSRAVKTTKGDVAILDEEYSKLQSILDKAVKNKAIHKNKAARLKSRILASAHANKQQPTPRTTKRKSKS